jgi:hypothetical protein
MPNVGFSSIPYQATTPRSVTRRHVAPSEKANVAPPTSSETKMIAPEPAAPAEGKEATEALPILSAPSTDNRASLDGAPGPKRALPLLSIHNAIVFGPVGRRSVKAKDPFAPVMNCTSPPETPCHTAPFCICR